ncbi:prepilin-type N-terminal cleavage/methylation domain-containing protein [Marinobacter sp. NP-4(2019)]|uniref:type IV pilin protein n=1 Tax=Marinobacter sp. NP-4(2019) TaxID=2488665 RepID=UPI000FC3EB2E|nr:type IV pilin protein [Marinobacter sp. NP-4(2019)]AZT82887.1 prepilin-type N-terminal cleavage/methylation domain-containing protein [Marinobacter sp. NP-4(2019)]
MRSYKAQKGFTLIELMIVVAIIGIIAAIAYPSYTEHVRKTKRSDGQGALMGLAAAMERHYASNNSYEDAAAGGADTGSPGIYPDEAPLDGNDKYYDLTIQSADATTYTLRATPKGAQAGDGMLELDSTGARRWDRDDSKAFETGENTWSK